MMSAGCQLGTETLGSLRYIAKLARAGRYSYMIQDYHQLVSITQTSRLTRREYSSNESSATGYVSWPTPPGPLYDIDEQAYISTWHKQDAADS